jgi:hypothetical protein
MEWSDIAKSVIGLGAPLLGEALGGPLGAAAGKILAQSVGAADPTAAAVGTAIATAQNDPAQAALLAQSVRLAEAQWAAALADIGKAQVAEVGATMRAESASSDPLQRWWRPLYALELTAFECPGFAIVLGHGLWTGAADIINGFASLSGLLIAYMGARFGVLGVYVAGRSFEKSKKGGNGEAGSLVGAVVKAVTKKK